MRTLVPKVGCKEDKGTCPKKYVVMNSLSQASVNTRLSQAPSSPLGAFADDKSVACLGPGEKSLRGKESCLRFYNWSIAYVTLPASWHWVCPRSLLRVGL
jgi:hypothetical protein